MIAPSVGLRGAYMGRRIAFASHKFCAESGYFVKSDPRRTPRTIPIGQCTQAMTALAEKVFRDKYRRERRLPTGRKSRGNFDDQRSAASAISRRG
jgi:hypothetical protein